MEKKTKKKSKKSTKIEVLDRVMDVYRLQKQGLCYVDIIRYGTEKWGVTRRNIDRYIREATKIHREQVNLTLEAWRKEANEKIDAQYEQSILEGDNRLAARLLLIKNKINGFERVDLHVSGVDMEDVIAKYGNKEEKKEQK